MKERYFVKCKVDTSTYYRLLGTSTVREFATLYEAEEYANNLIAEHPDVKIEITKITYETVDWEPDPLINLSKQELIEKVRELENVS